jgi:hypothetical protein
MPDARSETFFCSERASIAQKPPVTGNSFLAAETPAGTTAPLAPIVIGYCRDGRSLRRNPGGLGAAFSISRLEASHADCSIRTFPSGRDSRESWHSSGPNKIPHDPKNIQVALRPLVFGVDRDWIASPALKEDALFIQ